MCPKTVASPTRQTQTRRRQWILLEQFHCERGLARAEFAMLFYSSARDARKLTELSRKLAELEAKLIPTDYKFGQLPREVRDDHWQCCAANCLLRTEEER